MKNRGFTHQNFNIKISGGFTLIELLVVIAVIGILASVVMASLNSARVKARNARRTSDVKQLVNAFNLGVDASGSLPNPGAFWVCLSAICYDSWVPMVANSTVDAFITPYLPTKPSDPVGGNRGYGGYVYYYNYGGGAMYDGSTLPVGSIIHWTAELPYSPNVCAPGKASAVVASYVSCIALIAP